MNTCRALIIGGGIGGLTCAVALLRAGFDVDVCEQADHIGDVGAGITVPPNAARVFDILGLGDALAAIASEPEYQELRHWRTGQALIQTARGQTTRRDYGAGYFQTHRADLHAVLADGVRSMSPSAIRIGHKLTNCGQDGNGVFAEFTNGNRLTADILIGADGVRSVVRSTIFNPAPPVFTGHVAWRGLVPAEKLSQETLAVKTAAAIGPGRIFARYLLRRGTIMNYVALARSTEWQAESWSAKAEVDDVRQVYAGWHPEVMEIIDSTPPDNCFKWGLFTHSPLPSWSKGRIVLLGDAAHPMLPFMGQGAAMAIEDGLVMARAISAATDPSDAFHRYEKARRARVEFVRLESAALGDRLEAADTDQFNRAGHRNEDTLGVFAYDVGRIPV